MQQFRTVTGNNWFPSLAPDVPGRHFPQRNQVSGKIRVAGSEIFSWAAHGACFQRNNTVHSELIGGGEESASGTKNKKKNWRRKNTLPSFPAAENCGHPGKKEGHPLFCCSRLPQEKGRVFTIPSKGSLLLPPTHTPCGSMPLSPQSTPLKRVAHAGSILPNPG